MIHEREDAIRELSTPVLKMGGRLLMLPVIGHMDVERAKQLSDAMLAAIREHRALVLVLDITGLAAVDTEVISRLAQSAKAARLLGSTVMLTGISVGTAASLVHLGADLPGIQTFSSLEAGMAAASDLLEKTGMTADA
jgi:rsbT co-antagonist protein RsbR